MLARSAALLLALAACGDDGPAPAADAGPRDDATTSTAPAPPMAPALGPCPDGWAETMTSGITACVPPDAPADCPAGQAAFPDVAGCTPVGTACPAGEFPVVEGVAAVLYVRPGGTGAGTMSDPFGRIRDAMQVAPAGSVVALAKGTYDEAVDVYGGVTVVGACSAETVIAPASDFYESYAARLGELNVALRNVTVAPAGDAGGILFRGSGSIEGVIVDGAYVSGMSVPSATTVDARDFVIRGTRAAPGGGGRGLDVRAGATVTIDRLVVEDGAENVLLADEAGTTLTLRRAALRRNGAADENPRVFAVQDGATATVSESIVEDNRGATASVLGAGAVLRLDGVVVRGGIEAGTASAGIVLNEAGRLEVKKSWLDGLAGFGVGAVNGAAADLEDVILTDTGVGAADIGIAIALGSMGGTGMPASLRVQRVHIGGAAASGIMASNQGAAGVPGGGEGTVDIEDLTVDGAGQDRDIGGFGIGLGGGITGTIRRVRVDEARSAAILLTEGATDIALEDVVVRTTVDREDGTFGRALEAQAGARATVTRGLFETSREVSVLAITGSSLELRDVTIRETLERGCAATTCSDAPGGVALGVHDTSTVVVDGFSIDSAALCGVQVTGTASLDLSDGAISGTPVGACVQVAGFDLARLTDGVEFRDNEINVDTTDHDIPVPADPLPFF